jgi:hypothetical protein
LRGRCEVKLVLQWTHCNEWLVGVLLAVLLLVHCWRRPSAWARTLQALALQVGVQ